MLWKQPGLGLLLSSNFSLFPFFVCFCGFGGLVVFFNSLVMINPFLAIFWLPDQFCHKSAILNK